MFAPALALAALWIAGPIQGDAGDSGCPRENNRDKKPPNLGYGPAALIGENGKARAIGGEGKVGGLLYIIVLPPF
ncbi:hypothetical protein PspKH34_10520 [Parageobacillus sp. KH3-4]|nr:hypothetical protein PspKH34_10520 [Parageobacillus sp. KH3-4]